MTDTVIAGAATGVVGAASIAAATGHAWNVTTLIWVLYSTPVILLNGTSAVYGFISRASCREEQRRH